ncbi:hypothetical protein HOT72_gp016 [Gordonia phage Apricot]|uniref:Uncharacterized protein n=1 Tax=Gordonia phage Apricot TaxID=2250319 RepID=A0A345L124_9CAUD|nr:hypothetical protein HOT72_gp016 [Gordonia phage Apricot]AXH48976.1 hypothetical protein SEA_APRICOT_16 [Gordonia phage Apricot]QHJ86353.1 hypothetical protein SEA_KUWABARA_16 [Gordonia phage Kuwabara]
MGNKPVITDEMVDAEIARQELNRRAGVLEVEGRVDAKLSVWQVFIAVLAANLATSVVVGLVVFLLSL